MSASMAAVDPQTSALYRALYLRAWVLSLVIILIELVGARLSGSAALRADVYHVAGDMLVATAPLAISYARRRPRELEVLLLCGGIAVALLLVAIGLGILAEARERLKSATAPQLLHGWLLSGFALMSAAVNFWQHRVLSQVQGAHRDVTHQGFHFHVQMDLLKNLALPSLGALIALHVVEPVADGWAAAAIGGWIVARGLMLLIGSSRAYRRREPFAR
jgi:cobalt-zinc-cadmium efflux system protein